MQNVKLLVITLVLTLGFVFGFSWIAQTWLQPSTDPLGQYSKTASMEELLTDSPHALGPEEEAEFTIVEFSDFLCPACGSVGPQLKALVNQYPDQVRLVYRHFPLQNLHPTAYYLAEIAEAAAAQGKFWEMHDFIFAHQFELSDKTEAETLTYIVENAASIGVDGDQLRSAMESGEYQNAVEEDLRRAEMLQLNFTPSIFLNGQLMPIDQVESTISEALKP